MRTATLILLIFCAVISGWTAALAQVQGLGAHPASGTKPQHHERQAAQDAGGQTHMPGERAPCNGDDADCTHETKSVHPLLCAACFAVEVTAEGIAPQRGASSALTPLPQTAMRATDHRPRFPPPKGGFQA